MFALTYKTFKAIVGLFFKNLFQTPIFDGSFIPTYIYFYNY